MNHGGHGEHGVTLIDCPDEVTGKVLDAATRVHRELGPGLLESVYESALAIEMMAMGLRFERQVEVPASYKGQELGLGFRADLLIEGCLLLELKVVEALNSLHLAQMLTYLRLMNLKRGYLLNFNVRLLKEGIKRVSI